MENNTKDIPIVCIKKLYDIKETKGRTGSNAKRFQDVFRFLGEFAAAAILVATVARPWFPLSVHALASVATTLVD